MAAATLAMSTFALPRTAAATKPARVTRFVRTANAVPHRSLVVRAAATPSSPSSSRRGFLSTAALAAAVALGPAPAALAGDSLDTKIKKQTAAITGWVENEREVNPSVFVAMMRELEQVKKGAGDGDGVEGQYQDMRLVIQSASSFNRTLEGGSPDKEKGAQVLASIKEILATL